MKLFLHILLPALLLALAAPLELYAAEERRVNCGEYSFELPPGFELRNIEIDGQRFDSALALNSPFSQKDLSQAVVTCLREKKTDYKTFVLPHKDKIYLSVAARRQAQMFVSATESIQQNGLKLSFSLLEERVANSREIKGRERFIVAIELNASSDGWHTIIFVSDFRKFDNTFDADEYKARVAGAASLIVESIIKNFF